MKELREFWQVARWFLVALYGVIVSAGAINASYALAKLHQIDPADYGKDSIFVVFGLVNLLLTACVVFRGIRRDMK